MVKMWLQFTINLIKAPGGQNNLIKAPGGQNNF